MIPEFETDACEYCDGTGQIVIFEYPGRVDPADGYTDTCPACFGTRVNTRAPRAAWNWDGVPFL